MYEARCISWKGVEVDHRPVDGPTPTHRKDVPKSRRDDLLKRPDSSVLNEAIPVFFIGRNPDGLWIARNADGSSGGLFLFKRSALRFARNTPLLFPPATMMVSKRFELDIANQGNRYAGELVALKRKLAHARRKLVAIKALLAMILFAPSRALSRTMAERRIHRAALRLTSAGR